MLKSLAIIPARGGSKRIPNKNIKEFLGRPIISYSIEAAIKSDLFDEVMVSTDSKIISDIAIQYNASVPFMRSDETSGDNATTESVLIEVINNYKKKGTLFDVICCIYPAAPFVTPEKLKEAYNLLEKNPDADSVVPVVRYSFPPQRGMIVKGKYIEYQHPENATKRSQDLEPIFHDCGQFYFSRTNSLLKYEDIIAPKCIPIELSEKEVQDIDNLSDWDIAMIKYQFMNGMER